MVIVSEPYLIGGENRWYREHTGFSAIGINLDSPVAPTKVRKGDGYIAVKFQDFVLYSSYFSPNRSMEEFKAYLAALKQSLSRW